MNPDFDSIIPREALKIDSENVHESQLMQQCFDIVGVFVMAFDLDGNITMINQKASEILDCSKEDLKKKNFLNEIVSPEKRKQTSKLFRNIISGEDYPESANYYLNTCNGDQKIIIGNNITIRDKKDRISGVLISGKDVTDYLKNQKKLRNDIRLYRRLANNVPNISLLLFNKDFRFIIAEGREELITDCSAKELEGSYLRDLQIKNLRSIWTPVFRKAITGDTISTEYRAGNNFYSMWAFPLKRGSKKRNLGMAIIQNITRQKLKEIELEKTVDEAEKENREKSDFFARVTHEIRTPLNAIMGFTEQLLQTQLDNRQEEYVHIIDQSSEHLVALINDVLLLSKIDASEIRFEESPFRIEDVVKYVHSALENKALEKKLNFDYQVDESLIDRLITGDPFRLRQILLNLLNNAIKFTHEGSVNLNCYMKEESENNIVLGFDVSDTGIGIKPENIEKIFEQFRQADSNITSKYGGTGLGLTICKKLIEMQNGSLKVSSQENEGTTFTFEIPYKRSEVDSVSPVVTIDESPDLQDKKVLLVDDDSVNRLLGKVILDKLCCIPDIANSGEEAISFLDKNTYDLVLLDIHMPGINGIEVAKYIRRKFPEKKPRVIAVTAAVMKEDVSTYFKAGIDDFLIKPYKEFNLRNKIARSMNDKVYKSKPLEPESTLEKDNNKLYDLSELKKMAGDNQQFINKMVSTFIENSEKLLEDFEKYLPQKQWKEIGESAHKVLPSYRHLEIRHIRDILTDIKVKTLIERNYQNLPDLVCAAKEEIEKLLPEIRKEIE